MKAATAMHNAATRRAPNQTSVSYLTWPDLHVNRSLSVELRHEQRKIGRRPTVFKFEHESRPFMTTLRSHRLASRDLQIAYGFEFGIETRPSSRRHSHQEAPIFPLRVVQHLPVRRFGRGRTRSE